ncbi:hypothetical protein, partial [Bradyrhizobium jicamae]|uniref:hypothetical protein n=1 Tax=Bradyrhizobium jicamae TaxID=280332 RepID=UPI0018DC55DC
TQAGNEDPNTKADDSERDPIGDRFSHARIQTQNQDRYKLAGYRQIKRPQLLEGQAEAVIPMRQPGKLTGAKQQRA